jgi:hypothetical protein
MISPINPPRRSDDIEGDAAAASAATTPAPDPTHRFAALTPEHHETTPEHHETGERYEQAVNPVDREVGDHGVAEAAAVQEVPRVRESSLDHPQPAREPISEQQPVRAAGTDVGSRSYAAAAVDLGVDHDSVLTREKEQFGGIKVGSAFFGWVAAAGIAVLLTSLLTAAGVVLSLTSKTTTTDITNQATAATGTAKTVGLVGAILLLVVLFVAYYCGGYVAARMARFNGATQGLAVWLWGIVFAIVIFILVKIAGSKYNILTNLNLPRIPVDEGSLTTTAIIAIAAIIIVTLGAAVLGGLAGMRFHRNVDKAGLAV